MIDEIFGRLLGVIVPVGMVIVMVSTVKSTFGPARSQLETWAGSKGFKLISASPRLIWRGPFFLDSGMRKVFRIVAMDEHGVVRRGWACCGWFFASWKSGLEDKVVVEWDS